MSTESSDTTYALAVSVGGTGDYNVNISLDSAWGITDAFMLQLATTLQGLTWPAGTTFGLTKQAAAFTDYTADLTLTPPAFT